MATKTKQDGGAAPKGGGGGEGGGKSKSAGKKQQEKGQSVTKEHPNAGKPAPKPRLHEFYVATVRPRLMQQFSLGNPHEIPILEKIVINVGMGEAIKQPKILDAVV